jgi:hypothetical protein
MARILRRMRITTRLINNQINQCAVNVVNVIQQNHLNFKFAFVYDMHSLGATPPSEVIPGQLANLKPYFANPQYLKLQVASLSDPGKSIAAPALFVFPENGTSYNWEAYEKDAKLLDANGVPDVAIWKEDSNTPAANVPHGHFYWPGGWGAGHIVSPGEWQSSLTNFYNSCSQANPCVGGVFPGFWDAYQASGPAFFRICRSYTSTGQCNTSRTGDTDTLNKTLDMAADAQKGNSNIEALQISTWNDWTEGTQIEPSVEDGTDDLTAILNWKKTFGSAS